MWYDYRFRAYLDRTGVTAEAERHIHIHRQAYNHTRYEYNALNTDEDNIGSAYQHQKRVTEWKDGWPVFSDVHGNRGNAQPAYPRRGFPRGQTREDVKVFEACPGRPASTVLSVGPSVRVWTATTRC
ncbi:hypothetical protein GCM10008995_10920 [Halobellus salinus]|uniref:Uncharacterized protein n=1 Tax=Halobellus salinus TaxID=931585 RepID=A0A830EDZ5_9EURY|nr:hypothetical protein GCM10008995_10920 [Halobellus salinus]SMP22041.1 hypothetical protein SAMN06265347_108135 [Halobellus salinus]